MDNIILKAKYSESELKRFSLYMLLIGIGVIALSVAVYFIMHNLIYLVVCGAIGLALLVLSLVNYLKLNNPFAFAFDGKKFMFRNKEFELKQIVKINAVLPLGNNSPKKPEYSDINALAIAPPDINISGEIEFTLKDRSIKYSNIDNVLKIFEILSKYVKDYTVTLFLGEKQAEYTYFKDIQKEEK